MDPFTKEEIINYTILFSLGILIVLCYHYLNNMYIKYKLSHDKWHNVVDADDQLHIK